MSHFPTTRVSLLLRVKDTANHDAWTEFVSIYRPVICRFARQRGLQEADAQDLAQNVLCAVADRIADWTPDNERARFRTWLSRIALNQTITLFRRRKPDAARGGTTAAAILRRQEDHASDLEASYRREIFRRVARKVRTEFEEATWQAFWLTAVEGASVKEAARSLGRSVGAIYTARSRVIHRLQESAKEFSDVLHGPAAEREASDE
jgi:RNA polymerase sigma-70 factor (ECF subfamily)